MKKLLLLIIPVLILMNACNNKPSTDGGTASADSMKTSAPATMATDTGVTGGGTYAVVFIDGTNYIGVNAITVQALQGTKLVATATTNENGQYSYTGLASGTYNFAAIAASGKVYKNDTAKGIAYSGTASLPAIPLDSILK